MAREKEDSVANEDDDLDGAIRRALTSLRLPSSACLPAERLVEFHEEKLAAEEGRAIVEHIAVCGVCDLLLERIKSAEEAARVRVDTIPPTEWRVIDRWLTRGFER